VVRQLDRARLVLLALGQPREDQYFNT
jgi:hypothetical protein